MSRTITDLKTKIAGRLHGTTLNKIADFYSICEDAAELMLMRIDPVETQRKSAFINPVYDNFYDYALPSDFKTISNIIPQANTDSTNNSSLARTFAKEFINRKKNNQFALVWRDGAQFLRFSRSLSNPLIFDRCDSLTNNGSWAIGGNASNLLLDSFNFIAGSASLKCDVSSPGAVVNVVMRIGNNSATYFEQTVTAGNFEAFRAGWNLLRFDFATATETGTVDTTAMDYIKVLTTYNTNQTAFYEKMLSLPIDLSQKAYTTDGAVFLYQYFDSVSALSLIRLDSIVVSIGKLYDMEYYSNCLFRSNAGVWKAKPTVDTDTINLSSLSYKIYEAEISRIIAQMIQGAMGQFDLSYWNRVLEGDNSDNGDRVEGLYDEYQRQFPSERIEGTTTYYDTTSDLGGGYYPDIDADERSPY